MKKWLNLENIIYLTVFLLPFYLIKVKVFVLPTNILEIMIAGIFFGWLFSKRERVNWKNYFEKYRKYIILIGLILLGLLSSAFLNGNQYASFGIVKGWFMVPIIFLFLVGEIIPNNKANKIFLAYLFSASAVAVIALGYLFLGKITFDGRLTAFFNSPNYLAMYLAPAIMITLEQTKNEKQKTKKYGMIISLLIMLAVFYFTYSYAAWIAVAISSGIIFLLKNKPEKKEDKRRFFVKLLVVAGVFLALFFFQLRNEKFNALISFSERSSLASRAIIWKASSLMVENNPWFGIGSGNFQETYLEYQKYYPPYLEWAAPHPHNVFLAFWLYGGLVGFLSFLSLIVFFFLDVLKRIYPMEYPVMRDNFARQNLFHRVKKEPNILLFTALGIMLVILIHGIFDTTYFKNDLAIIFWLNFLALKD